jgi:hypothetical protein
MTGLQDSIVTGVMDIYRGREWLDTEGLESAGRVSYNNGLSLVLETFKEAQKIAPADLETPIITEKAYLTQELQFCASSDIKTRNSLVTAIQSFDDALRTLKIIAKPLQYKMAVQILPTLPKLCHQGMPNDAFHIACDSHKTRLNNIVRSPGINLTEKALLEQRLSNIKIAQAEYYQIQKNIFKGK